MPLLADLVKISFSGWAVYDAISCNSSIGIGSSDEEELILSRSIVMPEGVGVTMRGNECERVDALVKLSNDHSR